MIFFTRITSLINYYHYYYYYLLFTSLAVSDIMMCAARFRTAYRTSPKLGVCHAACPSIRGQVPRGTCWPLLRPAQIGCRDMKPWQDRAPSPPSQSPPSPPFPSDPLQAKWRPLLSPGRTMGRHKLQAKNAQFSHVHCPSHSCC